MNKKNSVEKVSQTKKVNSSKKSDTSIKYYNNSERVRKLSKDSVEEANKAFKKKLFPI